MRKIHEKQPPISTSTERLSKRVIAGLAAGAIAVAAVLGVTAEHKNTPTQDTQAWPVSDCSAEVTSAEKDPSGSLQVGVELGADCEGAQGHRHVTVKDPGLAKVEPGDGARVAVVPELPELPELSGLSGLFMPEVFVHFPQYDDNGKKGRDGLVDIARRVQ